MDEATAKYILEMDNELQGLVTNLSGKAASGELGERIEIMQQLSFRAGFYWSMLGTIREKTYG